MTKKYNRQAISSEGAELDLVEGLRALAGGTVLFHQAIADKLALQPSDHKCAELLAATGPLTAGELAERTGLTTGAITGVIDRLEAAGIAARRRDADDRRKVYVVPNPAFAQRMGALFEPLARATSALLGRYDADQLALVRDFVREARAMMETETRRLTSEGVG